MTQGEIITLISGIITGIIIPGYFAWKKGKLNDFLVQQMESRLPTKADKDEVTVAAVTAGVENSLHTVLVANGLSEKKDPPAAPQVEAPPQ